MSDIEYEFSAVPNRYQDVVQRMAVLYALYRPVGDNNDAIRSITKATLDGWRARVGTLTAAGWEPSRGQRAAHSILYARNCKPTFVMTDKRTRPCNNRLVCPFCYARWVRQVWMQIDSCFPAPSRPGPSAEELELGRELRAITLDEEPIEDEDRRVQFPWHLVERHHTFYMDVVPADNPLDLDVRGYLVELLRNLQDIRGNTVRRVDPVGAFIYTTVEPSEDGRQWKFHHRQLFKLTANHEFSPELVSQTDGPVVRHVRPTRRVILQAVARACRYPIALMRGDAERTVQLLEARRALNFRGHSRFRSFRRTQHGETSSD